MNQAENDMKKKKIVFSTGAGVSAESGISTFRDAGGLWEKYPVMQVCSTEGYRADPALVHQFYNDRRHQLLEAQPNEAHRLIADLEKDFDVRVITQNVDDLHERAGSHNITHLHGELMKLRSELNPNYTEPLTPDNLDSHPGQKGKNGHPMRPHIVFFGEAVPEMENAARQVQDADVFVVIGTSLNVYPAAALINYVKPGTPIYYIDPNPARVSGANLTVLPMKATEGMKVLAEKLRAENGK